MPRTKSRLAVLRAGLAVILCDLAGLSGAGLVVYGIWQVAPSGGYIAAGGFLLLAATLWSRRRGDDA